MTQTRSSTRNAWHGRRTHGSNALWPTPTALWKQMKPDTQMDAERPAGPSSVRAGVCVWFLSERLLHFILQHLSARAVAADGQLLSAAVADVC